MYKSHYIPRFIQKRFGDQCDVYDLAARKYHKGLVCYQAFLKRGLYSDEVEELASNLETQFYQLIKEENWGFSLDCDSESIRIAREYLFFSLVRTPRVGKTIEKPVWDAMLKSILTNGFESVYEDAVLKTGIPEKNLSLILTGSFQRVITDEDCEPFMITENGVTFLKSGYGVYPIGKNEAVLILPAGSEDIPKIGKQEVLDINASMIHDSSKLVAFSSFDENLDSFINFENLYPKDSRLAPILHKANEMVRGGEITAKIRENSGLSHLHVPKYMLNFLNEPPTVNEIHEILAKKDYGTIAAIEVFVRFGMLDRSCSTYKKLRNKISGTRATQELMKFDEFAVCEFDKCISVIFLEILSERGEGLATNRLYRYYKLGRHVIADPQKAQLYLERGCDFGHADCLAAYYKNIGEDPEYKVKIEKYLDKARYSDVAIAAAANAYLRNNDEGGFINCLEPVLKAGMNDSISIWVRYWTARTPYVTEMLEIVEEYTITHTCNAAETLARFYYYHPDVCPGKLEWYLQQLADHPTRYTDSILQKYGH